MLLPRPLAHQVPGIHIDSVGGGLSEPLQLEPDCVSSHIRGLIGAAHDLAMAGEFHLHCEGRGPSGRELYLQNCGGPCGGDCLDADWRARENWRGEGREGEGGERKRERRREERGRGGGCFESWAQTLDISLLHRLLVHMWEAISPHVGGY